MGGGSAASGNVVTEYTSAGQAIQYFEGGGLNEPSSIALDASSNVWVASLGGGLSEFNSSGSALTSTNGLVSSEGANGTQTDAVALDGDGDAWAERLVLEDGGSDFNEVAEYSSSRTQLTTNGEDVTSIPRSIAIDSKGNVWVGTSDDLSTPNVSVISQSRTETTYNLTSSLSGISFDGSGVLWAGGSGLRALNSSASVILSEPTILTSTGSGVAVDGSGDVWTVFFGGNSATITEVIGAATPVITPIAAGLPTTPNANGTSNLATRP